MTTEEKTATATNRNGQLDRYKLTPDELRDGSKLKAKLLSTEALFSYGSLAANASGVPGLGAVIVGLEAVVNSVDRVPCHRRRCKTLKNSWVNLVNLIHINRSCMKQECLVNILDSVAEALEVFKEYLDEWSRLSWIKSWRYRHAIGDKLDQFHQAFEEASQAVPDVYLDQLAVLTNNNLVLQKLHEELQQANRANSSVDKGRIHDIIYTMRMNRTLDVSDLPAYLDTEVSLLDPKVDQGRRYEIALGRWLGREIVALKFPVDFEILDCKRNCGGSKTICSNQRGHEKATNAMKRFRRQVDIWRALDHPNVLKLHGWCKVNGDIHLVTPWIESGNVRKFIERNGPSSIERLRLIRDIVNGLIYVHSKDVVHGSLSPTNVLVRTEGAAATALIGDFSLAKIVRPNDRVAVTDIRDESATLRFQAPEVNIGTEGPGIRPEADVFAWSTTSVEIISGVMPYEKENELHPLYQRVLARREGPTIEEHPSPIWESCPGLWDLLVACRNDNPHLRPHLNNILTKLDEYIQLHEVVS